MCFGFALVFLSSSASSARANAVPQEFFVGALDLRFETPRIDIFNEIVNFPKEQP
jgi:hypothetical protein